MEATHEDFIKEALEIFPELKEEFEDYEYLHLQMDRFRYRVERELEKQNKELVLKSYMLAQKYYLYGNDKMKDAVDTCFVEGILTGHNESDVKFGWELMPKVLQELYTKFWGKNAI